MHLVVHVLILSIGLSLSLSAQPLDLEKLHGMQARSIGPAGMSGRVTAIDALEENPDVIYAGTASGVL